MAFRLLQLFLLLVFIAGSVYLVARGPGVGADAEPAIVTIAQGASSQTIAEQLKEAKLIRSTTVFRLFLFVKGDAGNLKPGTYTIARTSGVSEIIDQLVGGKSEDIAVLFIEGWTSSEMGDELERKNILKKADYLAAVQATDSRTVVSGKTYSFLAGKPATAGLEGFLFPDTYRLKQGSTASQVIERQLDTFESRVSSEIRAQITARNVTLFDALTLASIVEMEVPKTADRRKVADLFWRRLAIGQPLQSDATVNYVTGKNRASPSIADTEVESPYNTYRNAGLPPGPIGNPSLDSIQAVANPEPNEFFYFLTDADGNVHYARTFEEHVANKTRYLR